MLHIGLGTRSGLVQDVFALGSSGGYIVIGRHYFTRQVETLLELARSTTDPQLAISLTEKAADLKALVDELSAAPDPSPCASDVAPVSIVS
jgi:hypothetical protein